MHIDTRPEEVGLSTPRLDRVSRWMRRWVDSGRLPGLLVAIVRDDRLAWFETRGLRDVEEDRPVEPDTIYRLYSMTKPITTVAALMLYEEGCYQLDDPVANWIPAFSGTRVFAGGDADRFETEPLARPITVHDLMTHTSGLTYAFHCEHPVDVLYHRRGVDFNANLGPLADLVEAAAAQPLAFQPGARWNYGVSTDVLGRLVEIWSGLPLDAFLAERIFLAARHGRHRLPRAGGGNAGRFASNYTPSEEGGLALLDAAGKSRFLEPAATLSGGGGLVSTAADYLRFARMLRGRGVLEEVRLLGRKTVEHMTTNQLPGDLADMGQPTFSETPFTGIGFGLGVSVMLDPARARIVGSPGEYAWGGIASTAFWIDPAEDLVVLLLHPALAVVDLPHPARAPGADLPGAPLKPAPSRDSNRHSPGWSGYTRAPSTSTGSGSPRVRILLVNGNTTATMTETLVATARAAAAPGTEIAGATGTIGAAIVSHRADEAIAEHAMLKAVADHDGAFDGVLIGVSTDPALGALRALLPVPVVGMTEAALLTACMLGGRFGLVTFSLASAPGLSRSRRALRPREPARRAPDHRHPPRGGLCEAGRARRGDRRGGGRAHRGGRGRGAHPRRGRLRRAPRPAPAARSGAPSRRHRVRGAAHRGDDPPSAP